MLCGVQLLFWKQRFNGSTITKAKLIIFSVLFLCVLNTLYSHIYKKSDNYGSHLEGKRIVAPVSSWYKVPKKANDLLAVRVCFSLRWWSSLIDRLFVCGRWAVDVVQSLPKSSTLNSSLYMVYAGYQDYFFSLYDDILTPTQTLNIVSDVVSAIVSAIQVSWVVGMEV